MITIKNRWCLLTDYKKLFIEGKCYDGCDKVDIHTANSGKKMVEIERQKATYELNLRLNNTV